MVCFLITKNPKSNRKTEQNAPRDHRKKENIPTSDSSAVEKWWDERMRERRNTKMVVGLVWKKIIMAACCLLLFLPAVSQVKDVGDLVFEICNSLCFLVSPITNVPVTCSHDQK
jgi:hypothetical protein